MKQNTYQAISVVFTLFALVCAFLYYFAHLGRLYEWAFFVLMALEIFFFILNAFQKFRK